MTVLLIIFLTVFLSAVTFGFYLWGHSDGVVEGFVSGYNVGYEQAAEDIESEHGLWTEVQRIHEKWSEDQ